MLLQTKEFDIFVGSKIGSFKHIKYFIDPLKNSKKCIENLVSIKDLQKEDSVTCMSWGNVEETQLILGRKNQKIQIYDTVYGFIEEYKADFADGEIVGLGCCKRKLLSALSSGIIKIWSKKDDIIVDTGGKLDKMRLCDDDNTIFATGGEENELKIWNVGEKKPFFSAKNLANDWLQLRKPVWVTDLMFLPGEGGRVLAVCSRHGYVRLYDTRVQRRPVCNVEFEAKAATCISSSFDERQVLVGFGRGHLHQVDLRRGRPDKGFKGCAGAVTSIDLIKSEKLIVSTSLDRHLRIHKISDKSMVYKQYLTSKLSCVLVQNNNSTPLKNNLLEHVKEEKEDVKDDMDLLFENMETVGVKTKLEGENGPQEKKNKPSTEGSTDIDLEHNKEDAIARLLKSTEKQKRRIEKKRKEKKLKSLFYNA